MRKPAPQWRIKIALSAAPARAHASFAITRVYIRPLSSAWSFPQLVSDWSVIALLRTTWSKHSGQENSSFIGS